MTCATWARIGSIAPAEDSQSASSRALMERRESTHVWNRACSCHMIQMLLIDSFQVATENYQVRCIHAPKIDR